MPIALDQPQIDTKWTFEIRERYERRLNRDFLSSNPDDRSDLFTRLRPGLDIKLGKSASAVLQYQVAHDWIRQPGRAFTLDNVEAAQALLRFTDADRTYTFGRQKIAVGTERLIGPLEWANVARSFDGVRFQNKAWDAFAVTVGVGLPRPERAELLGVVHKWAAGQTMFAFKGDKVAAGRQEIWTLDHSNKIVRGALDFDYEVAIQGGDNAGIDHEAWAGHAGVGYKPDKANRFYLDVNAASGGHRSDRSQTFDNLYPTNHRFYGSMDTQSWRNMQEISVGYQRAMNPKVDVHAHGHWFSLMDAKDAWYSAAGPANKRFGGTFKDPSGLSGKQVGFEVDLEATYRHDAKTTYSAGIGVFEPGSFIKNMNGGSADRQTWFFVQVQRKY